MRKPSLAQIVHATLFPRQRPSDPVSFAAHITRHLVPEVRIETNTFYGPIDCIEAQYPGLDYAYPPHRLRLARFPWHRRLFRAFDELKLTEEEISELCCWEGTKSARQRYELEEGITVRDTTGDNARMASPTPAPEVTIHPEFYTLTECEEEEEEEGYYDVVVETQSDDTVRASHSRTSSDLADFRSSFGEGDYSDEEMESCGVALNHRLMAATAARAQGANVPLDEDYEQWLKDANERGGYDWMVAAIRANQSLVIPEAPTLSPSSMQNDDLETPLQATQVEEGRQLRSHQAVLDAAERRAGATDAAPTRSARFLEHWRSTDLTYFTPSGRHLNWHELLADDDVALASVNQPQPAPDPNTAR